MSVRKPSGQRLRDNATTLYLPADAVEKLRALNKATKVPTAVRVRDAVEALLLNFAEEIEEGRKLLAAEKEGLDP
jgi:predicted DNA-binding protein